MKSVFYLFALMAPLSVFAQKGTTRYFKVEGKEIVYFHEEGKKTVTDSIVKKDFTILLPQEKDVQLVLTTNGHVERYNCKDYGKGAWADMETYNYEINDNLSFEFLMDSEGELLKGTQNGKQLIYRIVKLDRNFKQN